MNAQKKVNDINKRSLEIVAGGGSIQRSTSKSWLSVIFKRLSSKSSDLTLEAWQQLERKRGVVKGESTSNRDHYLHMRWHI